MYTFVPALCTQKRGERPKAARARWETQDGQSVSGQDGKRGNSRCGGVGVDVRGCVAIGRLPLTKNLDSNLKI